MTPSGASLASFAVFFTGRVACRGSCGGIIGFFVLFRRRLGCSLFAEGLFRRGSFCFFCGTVYLFRRVGYFGCWYEESFFLCLCWFFVLHSCCDGEGNRENGQRNNCCFVGRFGRRCCCVCCLLLSRFGFRYLCFGCIHSRFRSNSSCCYFSNCRFFFWNRSFGCIHYCFCFNYRCFSFRHLCCCGRLCRSFSLDGRFYGLNGEVFLGGRHLCLESFEINLRSRNGRGEYRAVLLGFYLFGVCCFGRFFRFGEDFGRFSGLDFGGIGRFARRGGNFFFAFRLFYGHFRKNGSRIVVFDLKINRVAILISQRECRCCGGWRLRCGLFFRKFAQGFASRYELECRPVGRLRFYRCCRGFLGSFGRNRSTFFRNFSGRLF